MNVHELVVESLEAGRVYAKGDLEVGGGLSVDGATSISGLITRTDEVWSSPSLLNSWAQYSVGVWDASFRKMPDGRVIMRGLVTGGALGSTAFILPAGYRPSRQQMWACANAGGVVRADVTPDGVVVPANILIAGAYSSAHTSLSEISFLAEL